MAFEVRCPSCQKLYAAEERMVGKRIRCRQCGHVFPVESPEGVPSLPEDRPYASHDAVQSSDLTGTRKAVVPPPPDDSERDEEGQPLKPLLRPSVPQNFPMSQAVEAWLPLALVLICGVWTTAEIFGENRTGKASVALLRLAIVLGLYLLLIAPVTYLGVRSGFRKMRRALPPTPYFRVVTTFALPIALGYIFWQINGGIPSLVTGLLMGVVFMAAVFWLLFRLDALAAANTYAVAAALFLVSTAIAAGLLIGANAAVNHAMLSAHADSVTESPLAGPLSWTTPSPDPHLRNKAAPAPDESAVAATEQPSTQPAEAATAPTSAGESSGIAKTSVAAPASQPSLNAIARNGSASNDGDSSKTMFDTGDNDSFISAIQSSKPRWLSAVSRPDGEPMFDQMLGPSEPSPFAALITRTPTGLFQVKEARFLPKCEISTTTLNLNDGTLDPQTMADRCTITPDGRAFLLLSANGFDLSVMPFGEAPRPRIQLRDAGFARVRPPIVEGTSPTQARLLGVVRDPYFAVLWSAPEAQCVQIYSYLDSKQTPAERCFAARAPAPGICAVSPNAQWFAILTQNAGSFPDIRLYNIASPSMPARVGVLKDVPDLQQLEAGQIAFAPDSEKVAMLLEIGGVGHLEEWNVGTMGAPLVNVTCQVPSQAEIASMFRGRTLQWINRFTLLAEGQTVVNVNLGGTIGTITSQPVVAEQSTGSDAAYLCYAGPDGHPHVATVVFDADALRTAKLAGGK